MDKREKIEDFNQIFLNIWTKFIVDTTPIQSLAIEYCMTTLIPSIGMFVKRANRDTLVVNFDEAETVERELPSYDHHPHYEEIKSVGKKPSLLTKPPKKESKDIDIVVNLINKLSNKVVDLKKNVGEGSSRPRSFHLFFKRQENPPRPPEAP
jgi:hypothetical protein